MSQAGVECEGGCGRPAKGKEGALCYACARAKRRRKAKPDMKRVPDRGHRYEKPRQGVHEAVLHVAESSDGDMDRAWWRFWKALRAYGWGPVRRKESVRKSQETDSRG